jgi:hypothetical protein
MIIERLTLWERVLYSTLYLSYVKSKRIFSCIEITVQCGDVTKRHRKDCNVVQVLVVSTEYSTV